jgi:hypothetical protein
LTLPARNQPVSDGKIQVFPDSADTPSGFNHRLEAPMSLSQLSIALLIAALAACNSSDFSGNASSQKKKNTRPESTGASVDGDDNNDDGYDKTESGDPDDELEGGGSGGNPKDDIEIDDEEKKVNCEDENEAVDPAGESFTFNTEAEARTFVNERCKTGISAKFDGAGAVGTDPETIKAVCNLKGYRTANLQEAGKYSSPHDNFIAYWDPAGTKFLLAGASGRNSKIKRLLCTEKFKKQCHDPGKKIDCVF